MSWKERRKFRRVAVESPITLSWPEPNTEYTLRDVSAGGVFVNSAQVPPLGSEVQIRLMVRKLEVRSRAGVVRTENGHGFALQLQLAPHVQEMLRAVLDRD